MWGNFDCCVWQNNQVQKSNLLRKCQKMKTFDFGVAKSFDNVLTQYLSMTSQQKTRRPTCRRNLFNSILKSKKQKKCLKILENHKKKTKVFFTTTQPFMRSTIGRKWNKKEKILVSGSPNGSKTKSHNTQQSHLSTNRHAQHVEIGFLTVFRSKSRNKIEPKSASKSL